MRNQFLQLKIELRKKLFQNSDLLESQNFETIHDRVKFEVILLNFLKY